MIFYQGELFRGWQGNLLIGALRGQALVRLQLAGNKIIGEERLLTEQESGSAPSRRDPTACFIC